MNADAREDAEATRARVSVKSRSMWQIRLLHEAPRYLLGAVAITGLAASARLAVSPPRASIPAALLHAPAPPDRAEEGYAALFARRYLTWEADDPQASERALEPFLGAGVEPNAGIELPGAGEQRVEWDEVVQAREAAPGQHVYTIAAQTDSAGLLYLTVGVTRTAAGSLALTGYPAFVGAPASTRGEPAAQHQEVAEPALATVLQRALRNYLAGSGSELAADLAPGARISLPSLALTLQSLQRLDWTQRGSAVLAVVQAQDSRGAQYTLAYELDVLRQQGRWEVSAVQTDPTA